MLKSKEVLSMNYTVDFAIIGCGPSGMAAALYASRAGLDTVIIEAGAPGGKLMKTDMVENYPGIPAIPGPDLGIAMYQQALQYGAKYKAGYVESVTPDLEINLKNGDIYKCKAILVATGTKEKLLNIPGEQDALQHGESFCAVCDGAFFRGKDVVVIGGGNSALGESLFLTQFVNKVTIVIRRDQFRAESKLQDEIRENPKIEVITDNVPVEVLLEGGSVSGVVLENVKTGDKMTVPCSGLFPYIGATPETEFVQNLGITDDKGYIKVDLDMKTEIPGLFAAGDCIDKTLRQIVTAAGDGALAAQMAFHHINGY